MNYILYHIYYIISYYLILYYTIIYYIILYCIVLYCIILYYIISLFQFLFESLRDENRPHPGNRTERKEVGPLAPTKSRLGSNSDLGLKLGRTVAHLGPTCA
jgi:hypothetical protein